MKKLINHQRERDQIPEGGNTGVLEKYHETQVTGLRGKTNLSICKG